MGWNHQKLNVKKFIVSPKDIARRADNVLAALDNTPLVLCNIIISTYLINGIKFILFLSLARLIMSHTGNNTSNQNNGRATL